MNRSIRLGVTVLLLLGALLAGLCLGSETYAPAQVWQVFAGRSGGGPDLMILSQLRLPRVILAAMVGILLAAAGASFQGLLRNDLADPYTVGVSSGAAVGAAGMVLAHREAWLGGYGVPAAAFGCGLIATLIVMAVARRDNRLRVTVFLLGGIVISSFLWSIVTLMMTFAGSDLSRVLFWLMGSFGDADWSRVRLLIPLVIIALIGLRTVAYALNTFALGEESARRLGVDVERVKWAAIALATLCTAAAVSVSGIIGFAGLIVPHAARRLFGADNRSLVLSSALLGSLLMVFADTMARTVARPSEIPVGVITALIGSPVFLTLLRREAQE